MQTELARLGGARPRWGLLLVNLGTPDGPEVPAVRRYLDEFLMDPRVIDLPSAGRWALVKLAILPFRPAKSAEAYRAIWTAAGSPLLVHTRALTERVRAALGDEVQVELAMRYQAPSIEEALERFRARGVDRIVVFPLFPQYASAATGSAVERVWTLAGQSWNTPALVNVPEFYDHPGFIAAFRAVAKPALEAFRPDFVLLSYHGLPERHVRKADEGRPGTTCAARGPCCDKIVSENRRCYRAQCFATSRALIASLGLDPTRTETAFQSRLGRDPWIRPYSDERIVALAQAGVRRLAVLCPAFTADCLETLEEVGIRARAEFQRAGGEDLALVPSLNSHERWVEAVVAIARETCPSGWSGVPPAAAAREGAPAA